jgi:hypothetical protein
VEYLISIHSCNKSFWDSGVRHEDLGLGWIRVRKVKPDKIATAPQRVEQQKPSICDAPQQYSDVNAHNIVSSTVSIVLRQPLQTAYLLLYPLF